MNSQHINTLQSIQNKINDNIKELKTLKYDKQFTQKIKYHQQNILKQQTKLNKLFNQLYRIQTAGGNHNALYQNNYNPFDPPPSETYNSFSNQYRIDGPLPRGNTTPKAIHTITTKQNILPGGSRHKTKKKK